MKPTTHNSRPKEWIPLSNFAMVDKVPDRLVLKDHLLPFEGSKPDAKFLWGLYGTSSMNHTLFLADAYASKHKKQMLTVQLWYHVDNFERVKSKITPEIADESGFIHLDRLQSHFRDQLQVQILAHLKKKTSSSQYTMLVPMSLEDIMVRHPECVRVIFDNMPKVNVVVHPVRQLYDETDSKPVQIATVRNIPKRLAAAEVRYLEHIKVVY